MLYVYKSHTRYSLSQIYSMVLPQSPEDVVFVQHSKGCVLPNASIIPARNQKLFCNVALFCRVLYDCARLREEDASYVIHGYGVALVCFYEGSDVGYSSLPNQGPCVFSEIVCTGEIDLAAQVLQFDILERAHECIRGATFNDPAAYVSALSFRVRLFEGDVLLLIPPQETHSLTQGDSVKVALKDILEITCSISADSL